MPQWLKISPSGKSSDALCCCSTCSGKSESPQPRAGGSHSSVEQSAPALKQRHPTGTLGYKVQPRSARKLEGGPSRERPQLRHAGARGAPMGEQMRESHLHPECHPGLGMARRPRGGARSSWQTTARCRRAAYLHPSCSPPHQQKSRCGSHCESDPLILLRLDSLHPRSDGIACFMRANAHR